MFGSSLELHFKRVELFHERAKRENRMSCGICKDSIYVASFWERKCGGYTCTRSSVGCKDKPCNCKNGSTCSVSKGSRKSRLEEVNSILNDILNDSTSSNELKAHCSNLVKRQGRYTWPELIKVMSFKMEIKMEPKMEPKEEPREETKEERVALHHFKILLSPLLKAISTFSDNQAMMHGIMEKLTKQINSVTTMYEQTFTAQKVVMENMIQLIEQHARLQMAAAPKPIELVTSPISEDSRKSTTPEKTQMKRSRGSRCSQSSTDSSDSASDESSTESDDTTKDKAWIPKAKRSKRNN